MINYIKNLFKRKPKIWFTSDWHFNHCNIIPYCNRPYKDVEEMNKAMIKIWNNTVASNDTVFFLGDFDIDGFRSFRELSHILNGNKHLISGNHDCSFIHQKTKDIPKRIQKNYQMILDYGWKSVQQTLLITLKDGTTVMLSHLPYLDDDVYKCNLRYKEMRPLNEGIPLIHGHLHAKYLKKNNMIDVSFDGKLGLYSEDEIIKLIKDQRNYIPSRLTDFYNSVNSKVSTE
jgi:calcineurin-like phosphoesterase family protein